MRMIGNIEIVQYGAGGDDTGVHALKTKALERRSLKLLEQSFHGRITRKYPVVKFESQIVSRQFIIESALETAFDQDFLGRELRHKFVGIVGIALGGKELSGADIQKCYTQGLVAPVVYGRQEVVEFAVQYIITQRYAGRHQLGDAALDQRLGIFELFANGHALARPHQFGQIGIQGMVRETRQFDVCRRPVGWTGQSDAQNLGSGQGVIAECLVEVAYTEKHYRIGMLAFHLDVLFHQRRLGYFFGHGIIVLLFSGVQKDGACTSARGRMLQISGF